MLWAHHYTPKSFLVYNNQNINVHVPAQANELGRGKIEPEKKGFQFGFFLVEWEMAFISFL